MRSAAHSQDTSAHPQGACSTVQRIIHKLRMHVCIHAQELQAIMDLPTSNPPTSSTPLALPLGSRTPHSPHKLGVSNPAGEGQHTVCISERQQVQALAGEVHRKPIKRQQCHAQYTEELSRLRVLSGSGTAPPPSELQLQQQQQQQQQQQKAEEAEPLREICRQQQQQLAALQVQHCHRTRMHVIAHRCGHDDVQQEVA
ncbi:hypothetical protein DUNSADRAFT_16333 [Dunaliella salina]|uniref:Uncharacterized protein n=1 Tax=Dunaliella salina TaxID=3046 RepID=A0ABQ7G3S1_DUNSA|nr:hypothetical protein DUNSADRAFT_16333 [Dunaliella salina]|eukprot:KAF5829260.1 hypothetical protein DUNSADRAFT_16333 [Dunaliella salina]